METPLVKDLGRTLGYLKRYWHLAAGTFLSLLIASVARLATPRLLQTIIDAGIGAGRMDIVIGGALGTIGIAIAGSIFSFLQGLLAARTAQGVAYDLRNELYAKIQSLSFSYHDRAQTGQLLTRATSDVEMVHRFVGMGFVHFISAILMMVGSIALLIAIDWQLALILLVLVPLTLGVFVFFAGRARPLFTQIQQRISELNTVLQENLVGVRVVKAFAREPYEARRYAQSNQNLFDLSIVVGRLFAVAVPLIFLIANLSRLSVYWIGGYRAIDDQLSVGNLVAFASYMMMAFFPMLMLGMIMAMIPQAGASAERIFEILDARSEVIERDGTIELPPLEGRVAFDDVSFRYFGGGELVLKDVSFVAEPGQTVALLGATGSGKSTIINLIPRFYDVTQGRVTVDGHDVRDVTLESLREQVGIVLQETTLFAGTIRENVAFGRPEASMEEVVAAARAAEAHNFITGFPEGYETRVGERGVTLSGGQKQRIAIARALLLDPRILILDDATSNVDYETELRIQEALDRLMHPSAGSGQVPSAGSGQVPSAGSGQVPSASSGQAPSAGGSLRRCSGQATSSPQDSGQRGRTSFVIAQRIATVLNADQILVLDRGEIVARGRHEELLRESPIYAEIYHSQLEGGPPEERTSGNEFS